VGLLACAGRFPVAFAEKARQVGRPVVCVGIDGMADPVLADVCTEFRWLRRMSLGFIWRTFRRAGVRQWTMAGKFHKHLLFRRGRWLTLLPDRHMVRYFFLRGRADNRDDNLLLGLIGEFDRQGFRCLSALDLCPELLVRPGVLTRRTPTAAEERDIRFGWALAKEMGRLDVGQSVCVREGAVLAVEAIEGTDQAILRAGELCGRSGFVVVKVAKPQQDDRFDVPTVGPATIESMVKAGGRVLAVDAGRTILLDEADTVARADRAGIAVTALTLD
jgi:DUF1009 family protein